MFFGCAWAAPRCRRQEQQIQQNPPRQTQEVAPQVQRVTHAQAQRQRHCNLYVIYSMAHRGIHLPRTNANGLDNYLRNSPNWEIIPRQNGRLNHQAAFNEARRGRTVLVTYNSRSAQSGHIAVICARQPKTWSPSYNANVPYASGSVRGRRPATIPLSHQFAASREPNMAYFVYVRRR